MADELRAKFEALTRARSTPQALVFRCVELFFSVVARQFLKRGDFESVKEFEGRLRAYLDEYDREKAHPYRRTYTGTPLVRQTPFGQTDRQRRSGRAWFVSRPQSSERLIHPPRPYRRHRRPKPLATNR